MGKKQIIEILYNYKKEFAEQYGILKIGVFGSVARDEVGETGQKTSFRIWCTNRRKNLQIQKYNYHH